MPDWQPNWDDVVFDHGRAQAAVDACNGMAGALDSVVTGFVGENTKLVAGGEWRGRYRTDFDREMPQIETAATGAVDDLRALAAAITTAMGAARREQAHRVSERERWHREREQELAAIPRYPNGKPAI